MITLITGLALSIFGSFGNCIRGSTLQIKWLNFLSHGAKRFILATIPTIAVLLPFKPEWHVWVISYFIILYFSLIAGWGTWFHIRSQAGWQHNLDAFWVEIILCLLIGKHWLPEGKESIRQKQWKGWTIEKSPTGQARSMSWYIDYNFIGMTLRGLGFGVAVCSILFYLKGFHPLSVFVLGLSFTMGWCYHKWYDFKDNGKLDKLPRFLQHTPNAVGEFLYGGLILGAPLYWICSLMAVS